MTTESLKKFKVTLLMTAECEDDARELLEDVNIQETDVVILSIKKSRSNKI